MFNKYRFPNLFNQQHGRLMVIAHRGASAYYPENTMAAFEGAVEMDASLIELDVMLSKDGVPVIFHDARLNAHTNGKGVLSSYPLAELKKLDAGSWFNKKFSNQKIPTLAEVLDFASDTIALNIEIKTEAVSDQLEDGIEEKCLQLVHDHGMNNHVLFSSFDYRAITHLRKLDQNMPLALLYDKSQSDKENPSDLLKEYDANVFNCSYIQLNKKRILNIRQHNIPCLVYTINRKKRMQKLIDVGVDGIITNKPDVLMQLINS